ncbi:MAG: hypothetical protein ACE5ER_03985 [Nitrospinaceae bacterium]
MTTYLKTTTRQISIVAILLFPLLLMGNLANANCMNVVKQIRGNYEVMQSDGGIWRFMEKSSRLRSDSMLGLQIDGKLQRGVTFLEDQCMAGKPLSQNILDDLQLQMDKARSLNNRSVSRTPAKKLLKMIKEINDALTVFMEKNNI